jgi:hypothetical protein
MRPRPQPQVDPLKPSQVIANALARGELSVDDVRSAAVGAAAGVGAGAGVGENGEAVEVQAEAEVDRGYGFADTLPPGAESVQPEASVVLPPLPPSASSSSSEQQQQEEDQDQDQAGDTVGEKEGGEGEGEDADSDRSRDYQDDDGEDTGFPVEPENEEDVRHYFNLSTIHLLCEYHCDSCSLN